MVVPTHGSEKNHSVSLYRTPKVAHQPHRHTKCLINDVNGECVGFFLPVEVQSYYKLRDPEE
jgi:hypothetical protein